MNQNGYQFFDFTLVAAVDLSPRYTCHNRVDGFKVRGIGSQAEMDGFTGAYQSVDKSATVKTVQANLVVDLLCTFEKTPLILRISFNNKKQVAGLFFLPPPKPKPATPKGTSADSPKPTSN